MARALRIEYSGAVYHVMSRGNRGEAIYLDDRDREMFLDCLEEACGKTGWWIHAWVLMGNHYHLLLETPDANLVAGMKWLQGTYTSRFNSRHKVFGHLFQGRYKALAVDHGEEAHFRAVSSYIHLNPVRAGLIRAGEEPLGGYGWSSYPAYLAAVRKRPKWLRTDRVLASVGISPTYRRASKGYEAFMEGRALECSRKKTRGQLEEEWRKIRRGWYLGDETFKRRLLELIRDEGSAGEADSHTGPAAWGRGRRWMPGRGLNAAWRLWELPGSPCRSCPRGGSGEAGAGLVVAATHDPVSKVDRWPPAHGPRKPRYPRGEGSFPVPPGPPGTNAQAFGEDVRCNKNNMIQLSDYGTDPFTAWRLSQRAESCAKLATLANARS